MKLNGQQAVSASFIATRGVDTLIVETYNMLSSHLFGKAFRRYHTEEVFIFDFHFYPDGGIKHYAMSFMQPDSSYNTVGFVEGVYCETDTCTWFASSRN